MERSNLTLDTVEGLPMLLEDGQGRGYTKNTIVDWVKDLMEAGQGVLFIDEFNNAPPAVQALLLQVVHLRRVGQYQLPDGVWIVCASNDVADAADGFVLAPPMANRLLHIEYDPDFADWAAGMIVNFNHPMSEAEAGLRTLFVKFIENHQDLWNKQPKSDEAAGKAWPSPRSWDNAASMCSFLLDHDLAFERALRGFVGENASTSFLSWKRNLRLPEYATLLADPSQIRWETYNASELYIILQMVIARITGENMLAAVGVLEAVLNHGELDVLHGAAVEFGAKVNSLAAKGEAKRSDAFQLLTKLAPIWQAAGLSPVSKKK